MAAPHASSVHACRERPVPPGMFVSRRFIGVSDGQDSTPAPRIDHFFSAVAARLDLWRDLSRAAQAWAAIRPAAATRAAGRVQRGAHRAPAAGGLPGLPGHARAERHQGAPRRRRRDGHGAAGAARLVGADVAELPQRCRGVGVGRRRGRAGARDADRTGRDDGAAVFRSAVRDAARRPRAGPHTRSRSGSCGARRTSSSTSRCSSARSRTRRSPSSSTRTSSRW